MRAAGRVFVLLWAVYLLTYGGGPHAVDEIAQVGATASLVKRGSYATDELFWTIAAAGDRADAQVEVGVDGQVYSKKGPVVPLVMAPWYALAMAVPRLDLVFTTLLAMSLVTAATAALLVLLGSRLGLSERGAVAAGLLYGLTGLAWPYTRLGFGEPLIAFAAVLAALTGRRGLVGAAVAGGCVALAAGTKWSAALLGVPVAAYVGWIGCASWGMGARRLAAFGAAGVFGFALLSYYNAVHFGSALATGYGVDPREGFTAPPLVGLYGLTVGPYRGILWYAPTVLLGAALLPIAARRAPAITWLAGGVGAITLGTYAAWWTWWGGYTWGPRFLLPACPLLCLMVPLAWDRLSSVQRRLAAAVAVLSGLVQLPGVLLDFNPHERALRAAGVALEASPILGHLRRLLVEGSCAFDLAWLGCRRGDPLLGALLGVAVLLGVVALVRQRWGWDLAARTWLLTAMVGLLVRAPQPPTVAAAALVAAAAARAAAAQPDDATIVLASPEVPSLWAHDRWRGDTYGFNPDDLPRMPEAARLLELAAASHRRLWLLRVNVPDGNSVEQWLAENAFIQSERSLYITGATPLDAGPPLASFAGGRVVLEAARVLRDPPRVQLLWRGMEPVSVFVHVYQGGRLVGQVDVPLRQRLNYVLPAAGGSVEVGLYRADGTRLSTSFPDDRVPIGVLP